MSQYVLLNGRMMDADEASVSVHDSGFLHGAGLFETLRAYERTPFRYVQHLDRLLASAKALNLPVDAEMLPTLTDARRVIAENNLTDARVRLTVTAGPLRLDALDAQPEPTVLLTAVPIKPYPPEFYAEGMTVMISDYRQSGSDPLCGHKATAYFARLCALREAQKKGCAEALWFTVANLLAEGSISNVFLVKDNVLRTPPLDTPVLPGITRAAVLELAREAGHKTEEIPLTINDLLDADEVFVTNSGFEVVPVVRVERRKIADEQPGPMTKRLLEGYRTETRANLG